MGSMLISIVVVLFITYSVLGWILYFMQPTFLYRPDRTVLYKPEVLGLNFEKVVFKSSDGLQLNGWYIPADNSNLVVLFCHGNGGPLS